VAPLHSAPAGISPAVRRCGSSLLRLAVGVAVLWFLVRLVGAAPFESGLRAVTWPGVLAAVTLTVATSVCSAWRWRLVARALGAGIGLSAATGAYYRSLFLNSVLPGGILGDVNRAVTQGRRDGDVGQGVRAVAWERLCGQVIQAAVTAVVLLGICLLSTHTVPAVVLVVLLGLFGLSANPVLSSLAVRFGGAAPTLAVAMSVSAYNVGTAVGSGIAGATLSSRLGAAGPAVVGTGITTLTLIPTVVIAFLQRRHDAVHVGACAEDVVLSCSQAA